LILIVALVQGWTSARGLSLSRGEVRYGWVQDFGFFPWETESQGRKFRWSRKRAGQSFPNGGDVVAIPLQASHPDIAFRPVRLRIYHADEMFRKKRPAKEVIFRDPRWISVEIPLPRGRGGKSRFLFETDRDWRPSRFLISADCRPLAVKFGQATFR
jgi:hypothetical protein